MDDDFGSRGYQELLQVSIAAALEAGKLLRQEFHRPGGPRGGSSHALMDEEAEALIRDRLTEAFPTHGMRGEELKHLNRPPQDPEQHIWLIDPNDGTASYLKGYRGAAVSIALLRSGIPVLGVVYAYCAPNGEGDLFAWAEGCGPLQRNGEPVERIWADKLSTEHTVLVSQAGDNNSLANAQLVTPARFRTIPSIAYRLALVAAGEAEVAVSLNSPQDWDYAAGHALLRGVGGELFDRNGQPVTYSTQGESYCGGTCVGGSAQIAPKLAAFNWQPVFQRSHPISEPYELVKLEPGQSIEESGLLSRSQGCLLGQFAGDALGSLVEFETVEEISLYHPQGVEFLEDGGTWSTIAGQPTDDSELALMLARSLIKSGHFDLKAIAQSYAYWYNSHPFDMGNAIGQALSGISRAIESGTDPVEAARQHSNQDSQANGALMRISPLAIFGHAVAEETLAEWARADARLSHPHPVCQDANAVFVIAIRYALRTGATPAEVYQYV